MLPSGCHFLRLIRFRSTSEAKRPIPFSRWDGRFRVPPNPKPTATGLATRGHRDGGGLSSAGALSPGGGRVPSEEAPGNTG